MESFERKRFWKSNWPKSSMVFDHDYTKAFTVNSQELKELNQVVSDIISKSLGRAPTSLEELRPLLDQTKSFSVKTSACLNEFVLLEQKVISLLKSRSLISELVGIQFPIDVRVVHPGPPPGYLDRKDAVDYLHCDGWRGEPSDGVNALIYCDVGDDSSHVQLYDVDDEHISEMENYNGPETDAWSVVSKYPEVVFSHRPGQVIFFDSFLPHRAKRSGDKVRISLNFTFRRLDPYDVIDERWERSRQNWDKYWYLINQEFKTFSERYEAELAKIDQNHSDLAREKRMEYVMKLKEGNQNVY